MMRSAIPLLLLLLSSIRLSAQVEINVKVRHAEPELRQLLRNAEGGIKPAQFAQYRSRYAFLEKISHVSALRKSSEARNEVLPVDAVFTLRFSSLSANEVLTELHASTLFEFAEENRNVKIHSAPPPDDPEVSVQWYHEFIRTFEAWETTRGDATVVIGVLDTGLDYKHAEFAGQVKLNAGEDLNGNGTFEAWPDTLTMAGLSGDFDNTDNDGNGYTDDVIGYDFTDQPRSPFGGDYLFEDGDPIDENDHGTLVSGIIAARADNNYGGAGIAPGCRLKVLRAFSGSGTGEDDDISRAIVYAADNGIQILNMSFGDIYPSQMMHEAIRYAYSKGVVMIASAGNGTGDDVHYPSGYNEVISVSASTVGTDSLSEFIWLLSSYGPTVSLCAPGNGIYTTVITDSSSSEPPFGEFSGTSTSAPMVSAAVALIFSQRGACSPQQVRGLLVTSADDIGDEGWDHYTGAGRLNIEKALATPAASNVQILSPLNDAAATGNSVVITGTVFDPQLDSFAVEYKSGINAQEQWFSIAGGMTSQVLNDTLAVWNTGGMPEGEYTLRLRVNRSNGSTNEDRIRLLIDRSAPVVEVKFSTQVWDNHERKNLIVFRSSDAGKSTLHFRPAGSSGNYQQIVTDKLTRNGEFLLGMNQLSDGDYEFFVQTENAGGLSGQSPLDTFTFSLDFVPGDGYDTTGLQLPMGYYAEGSYDFDGDGLKEALMSRYGPDLDFGRLKLYEFNAGVFVEMDSLSFKPVLIPKDVADTDGDGLLELLSSVNDSVYITEQSAAGTFPKQIIYSNLSNSLYAAAFADADGDSQQELLLKDFEDYFVYEGAGNAWSNSSTLQDNSGDYEGSVAPRVLSGDFDGDGNPETAFGDYDGDLLIYEYQGGNYSRIFLDTTDLEKSGSYLCQGDFDNDGRDEIFVATHSSLLRNDDFEYDPAYWVLKIIKGTADNTFQTVWLDYLYDIDTEGFNAATAGNLDAEPGAELIFTTFPRTYILDHDGSGYKMAWFHYGALCTHHLIADFDGNGVNEFALGRGDAALFFENQTTFTGPRPTANLNGWVNDAVSVNLEWLPVAGATEYRIWEGLYDPDGTFITLVDSTVATAFTRGGLSAGQDYLYVIQTENTALTPAVSEFSNAILLRPHTNCTADSAVAINEKQLMLYFSQAVAENSEATAWFLLNGTEAPVSVTGTGDAGKRLLLSFSQPFLSGVNSIRIDSSFRDAYLGPLNPMGSTLNFNWNPDSSAFAYLTHWKSVSNKEAELYFNFSMNDSVLDASNYRVHPLGEVIAVQWADAGETGVRLTVDRVAFGALGYPLTIFVTGVAAKNGAPITVKEGNAATFSAFMSDLSQVYVYPNPVRGNQVFNGVRFANLTPEATISIYSVSGRYVNTLSESDGDGGTEWNLSDAEGQRVKPGIYMYQVEAPGVEKFLGKFTVLE